MPCIRCGNEKVYASDLCLCCMHELSGTLEYNECNVPGCLNCSNRKRETPFSKESRVVIWMNGDTPFMTTEDGSYECPELLYDVVKDKLKYGRIKVKITISKD